jgi:poly(hydroxyalkanoate) granule-associated protein
MAPKSKKFARSLKTAAEHDVARKIWLAGVGAYGRMFDEAQDQVARISQNATEMFDDLVSRGEKVEDEVRSRISKSNTGARVVKFVEKAQEFGAQRRKAFEKRVRSVRATVSETLQAPMNMFMLGQTVENLAKRVEAITGIKTTSSKPAKAVKAVKARAAKATKAVAKAAKAVRKGKGGRLPRNIRVIDGVDAIGAKDAA